MKHYALLGDPVEHSLSPDIYTRLFERFGVQADFSLRRVPRGELSSLAWEGLSGFACTMPHKQDIMRHLDEISPEARRAGSVNIVRVNGDRMAGYSTDGAGALRALADAGVRISGARTLVLGTGGAARAAICALSDAGAAVTVTGRNRAALAALSQELNVDAHIWPAKVNADIFVNATPLGMQGGAEFGALDFVGELPAQAAVLDMVYAPRETALLAHAKAYGLTAVPGLEMLRQQAALAFFIWTGIRVDAKDISV